MANGRRSRRVVVALAALAAGWAAAGEAPDGEIQKHFATFLKKPTQESFLRVRGALVASPAYAPYASDLDDVAKLVKAGKWKEAQAKLQGAMPNLLLSPRAHRFASRVATALGDPKGAEAERAIADKCIQGILSTGTGTAERPYLVTRVADEYDVLGHLGKRKRVQGLRRQGDRSHDVIQCEDGAEVWFDITDVFKQLTRRFKER